MKMHNRPSRHRLQVLALGLATLVSATAAQAQGWPNRSVTFIVSQAAGASPDVMARMIADRLTPIVGQGVIIENKPGGGNVVGANAAARSAPDGYTFFFATSAALVSNPYLMKKLPYDPAKDFVPVALVTRSHQLVVVPGDSPFKTFAELVASDKAAPGKISIGVDSPRNLAGITAQALNKRGGLQLVLVPYPNINSGIQDTIAGRLQAGVFSVSITESLIRDGKLRALAVASAKRSEMMANVPTVAETYPGFDFNGWFMLMAPAGTPSDIVAKMSEALDKAVRDPKVKELAPKLGFEIESKGLGGPAVAASFMKDQLTLWQQITKELGLEAL